MALENFYNTTGFHWWMGVVEDRMDPLYLGRCRVRILGYHTKDKAQLPTEDLPWAQPIQPIISAAMTGVGIAPVGPVEGTWVVGFFLDGDDCQQPVFMGTIAGIPLNEYYTALPSNEGFQDPKKKYPLPEFFDEPDTNRLARNQSITETIVQKKKDTRDKGVQIAFGGTWDQPQIPYASKYPFNHVTYSEAGHAFEYDDTPSGERIHTYHKAGTFTEIDREGTTVNRIVGNSYEIIDKNGFVHIKGKANVTIDGTANVYIKNNCNLQVDGNLKVHAHGNIEMKSGKKMTLSAKDDLIIHSDKKIDINSKTVMNMKSLKGMNMTGTLKTVIASPVTEVATIKVNALAMTPVPPKPPVISPPSTISEKSPTEPSLPDPTYALSEEDRVEFRLEKIEAERNKDIQSKEYAQLKSSELIENERVSVAVEEPIEPQSACGLAQKVIEAAKKDIGILETGTAANNGKGKNYGGKVGGGETPVGQVGRIDEMVRLTGLNNQAQVKSTGEGYYWCAAAVTAWWKEAGAPTPPGSAACINWASWGKQKGYYSKTPKLGAAALFGPEGAEHHIAVVVEILSDGSVKTIEGNTSGGGFNRNGCGCFLKKPKMSSITGYVHLPPEKCVDPPPPPTMDDTCLSEEMKTYIKSLQTLSGKEKIPDSVIAQIPEVVCKFKINTPLRLAHFLAQCAHESNNFKAVRENLNYSAGALTGTFKKYFPSVELAKQYERNPQKIANRVYANRMENGDEASGDGYKYRGRGYIQLTGKVNYRAFSKFVPEDCVANPELVADKYPLLSAAWFWLNENINTRADTGATPDSVKKVTLVVNGGTNGLAERQHFFTRFNSLA
jgi:putative chitinase